MLALKGIVPPLVTPFDESGNIRYDAFERNFDKYFAAGIQGFLVLSDLPVKSCQIVGGNPIPWIGPPPEFVGLNRLV